MSNEATMNEPSTGETAVLRLAGGDVPPSADDSPTTAEMKSLLKRLGKTLKTPESVALRERLMKKEINPEQFRESLTRLADQQEG